ncbi:MAG: NYN domain-containing protein [Aphanocapsa sp. GSE-SYN-MK-11-07L]|jgi:hypothetical protein|nr:NYN domain-containing protein [Aphanocapsa sp. GSE-SYN-MK-11-07L]
MTAASASVLLLVDGYNMIGAWKTLKPKGASDRSGLEASRLRLVRDLIDYSAFQGYTTQVVFDAQQRDSPGNCEHMTEQLTIYFTDFGQTADSYIERYCALARHDYSSLPQRIIVATSDRVHQLTVVGYGAEWMSAQQLFLDVQAVNQLIRQKRQKADRQSERRSLAHRLDPAAKQRLEQLRRG